MVAVPLPDERHGAVARVPAPGPGRYLAMTRGAETELFRIVSDVVHVGRGPAADVFIDDPTVSRRHAVLVRRGDRIVILDDRSLNGVKVNGQRVWEAVLQDGDRIALGRIELRYFDVAG
jgi:pSer/pThr/pTyr-binding forkhead associated (FHA) protein